MPKPDAVTHIEVEDIDVREPLHVDVSTLNDKVRMDVRHYWYDKNTDTDKPGKKGINIPLDDVPTLVKAMLMLYCEHTGASIGLVPLGEGDDQPIE